MLNFSNDLRVAVLCSYRAPGLEGLLRHPHRGKLFDIACVVASEPEVKGRAAIEHAGVPVLVHPIRRFHQECGVPLQDREARRAYDALTVHVLEQLDADVVLMLGYLYVATDVLIAAYPDRVFNIHDSDLSVVDQDGDRRYVGLHSTRDAIVAGERSTRSTIHIVTPKLDSGPIVMASEPYPVAPFATQAANEGAADIVRAYAYAHREWMMRDCWADLAASTLELVSAGVLEEVAV
jgi:phosphoribosylglycinamide formyltransferase-1